MPMATYIGDPRGGSNPPACVMSGVEFALGAAVEVSDALAAKLRGNSHFRVGAPETVIEASRPRGRPRKVVAPEGHGGAVNGGV